MQQELRDTAVVGVSTDRTQEYQNLNYIPVQDLLTESKENFKRASAQRTDRKSNELKIGAKKNSK